MQVDVHLLPSLVDTAELADQIVVVVDILRATTTMAYALGHGAKAVIPCLEVDEAKGIATKLGADCILGGERGGVRIREFDLGNSPEEYTPDVVAGKTIVFTTTNGTKALRLARGAKRLLIGSFAHFSAICRELSAFPGVHILCAGTDGQITREDVLFAGAVVEDLRRVHAGNIVINDEGEIAADAWKSLAADFASGRPLAEILRGSLGARNLLEIGQDRDVEIAARIDRFDFLAEVDLQRWFVSKK